MDFSQWKRSSVICCDVVNNYNGIHFIRTDSSRGTAFFVRSEYFAVPLVNNSIKTPQTFSEYYFDWKRIRITSLGLSNPFTYIFFLSMKVSIPIFWMLLIFIVQRQILIWLAFFIKKEVGSYVIISDINHLSVNPTKWSNTLKQSVCCSKVKMDLRAYIFSY